ncbi:MAG: hypothetical protein AAF967_13325 [Pseudomonadota bacterium]
MATHIHRSALLCAGIVALFGIGVGVPSLADFAHAQAGEADTAPSGFVCMTRNSSSPTGGQSSTTVMIPNSEEPKLAGRGFVRSGCGGAVKWMKTTGPSMCALADVNDPAFVSDFLNTHGLTPGEICDLAARLPGGS